VTSYQESAEGISRWVGFRCYWLSTFTGVKVQGGVWKSKPEVRLEPDVFLRQNRLSHLIECRGERQW